MKQKLVPFRGCGTAMVTPFTKDGVDLTMLTKLLDAQLDGGIDAIISCGTTGEPSTMSVEEQVQVVSHTVRHIKGRVPVIAGVGGNNTAHCQQMCRRMRDVGADGLLAVTPYYNKTTQEGLIAHFTAVADTTDLPVILYNVPPRTGLNILPATLAVLAEHPHIAGIKEASADITQVTDMISRCGRKLTFYAGNDDLTLPLLSLGAEGVISVAGNIVPKLMHDLTQAFFEGDMDTARTLQLNVFPLVHALFLEVNPIPLKAALHLMGRDVGPMRLPLVPMSEPNRKVLIEAMKKLCLL